MKTVKGSNYWYYQFTEGAGGVLLGSHAFLAYGNALGVSWGDPARTQDIDFARSRNHIELALPASLDIATQGAIEGLEAGFLPAPGFRPRDKTATFVSKVDKQLRVDFLAPMVDGKDKVYEHAGLGVNLQPLRLLEFVMEDVEQAVIISAVGAVIVNVPDPARYALHKLLVHAERRTRSPEKARKDLRQAAALIEVVTEYRLDAIAALWRNILHRGAGWRSRARIGCTALRRLAPHLEALASLRTALEAPTKAAEGARATATRRARVRRS